MRHVEYLIGGLALMVIGCTSPAKVEVRPNPLVLEGKDAKGKLEAVIFDEDGKQITEGYDVTWLCVDPETAKVQQNGEVVAKKSGKTLVDVEIVGTEIHGSGAIEVKIASWVEVSVEALSLKAGQPDATVWAEVRADTGFPIKDYLATWKVDNPAILSIEQSDDLAKGRAFLTLKPLAAGETYVTASYKDLASDIRVVVTLPSSPDAS
jgi:hypothetical protein